MSNDEKRTIDDLIARYEFEPTLRDVYVEGDTDRSLVRWFLNEVGKSEVIVYEIVTVEIPAELVKSLGFENNNRGRVIALAHILEANLGASSTQITCLADRDFDIILKTEYKCYLLLFTDYACIEMYAFNETVMEKFLSLLVRRFPKPTHEVLTEFVVILQELFLIRLANRLLKLTLSAISWEKCCIITSSSLHFDSDDYVQRYLNANAKLSELERFNNLVQEYKSTLTVDPRNQINGHDFIDLLTWYIHRHFGIKELNNKKVIERALFLCLEINHLVKEQLFKSLLARI